MTDRQIASLDEYSKYLRSLQFTLSATCIAFLAILLSERRSTIALASKQIDEIYNYTLENNWNEYGVQELLNDQSDSLPFQSKTISFSQGEHEDYILYSEDYQTAEFSFLYHKKFLKSLLNQDAINFEGNIVRPKTLNEFKKFFESIAKPEGVYAISGINGPILHIEGYRHNNPYDETISESELELGEFIIGPKHVIEDTIDLVPEIFDATIEDEGVLILSWIDGYSDDLGTSYEDFITYKIPFEFTQERYRPIDLISACSAYPGTTNWVYGSFEDQFKALGEVIDGWNDLSIEDARDRINSQFANSGDTFQVFGIKFPSQGLLSWGLLIVLAIQLYFYVHFREFFRKSKEILDAEASVELVVPWMVLYKGKLPTLGYFGTVIFLPLFSVIVVLKINISIYPISEIIRYVHIIVVGGVITMVSSLLWVQYQKLMKLYYN